MSSEYEFHSYLTANQLQKERAQKDKKIVEVILEKSRTGLTISDYMRDDILHGVTHSINRFNKLGKKHGFAGYYMFADLTHEQAIIKHYMVVDGAVNAADLKTITEMKLGLISQLLQSLAQLSQDGHRLQKKEHVEQNETFFGYIQYDGHEWHIKEYIVDEISGNVIISMTRWDGTNKIEEEYDTGLPGKSTQEGDKEGVAIEYNTNTDEDTTQYFFSEDNKYALIGNTAFEEMEIMPFVALKDDYNNEVPYYRLSKTNAERVRREKVLKALNIDLVETSEGIFSSHSIPAIGTGEWNIQYGKWYRQDQDLKDRFSTEEEYHDHLVAQNQNQAQNTRQISDVHIGFAATPLFINETSAYAAYQTLLPLLLKYEGAGPIKLRVGSLKQEWTFSGVRIVRKQGVPKNIYDTPGALSKKKTKAGWYIKSFSKKKNSNGGYVNDDTYFTEEGIGGDDDDPILENIIEVGDVNPPDDTPRERKTVFEIRTISAPLEYTEIRIVGWVGTSVTTQRHNPDYPDGGIRAVSSVDLCDIDDIATYLNGLVIPLTFDAFKTLPIFKRDRLAKETLMLVVQGIAVTETPWYATTLFKIFMIILIVVATIVFAPAGQVGFALLGLGVGLAVSYALSYIAKLVKSPFLMAMITFAVGFMLMGGIVGLVDILSLAVEATGTYMNQKILLTEIENNKKTEAANMHRNKMARELKEIEDKFGLNKESNTKYLLYLASLPPVEHPNDFFGRALNTNLNEIDMKSQFEL